MENPNLDTSEYINPVDTAQKDIERLIATKNLAEDLKEDKLREIGMRVVAEFDIDKNSREEWEKENEDWIKLATQVVETKNEPFSGAANVKYPTLTMASVQFAARSFAHIFNGGEQRAGAVCRRSP